MVHYARVSYHNPSCMVIDTGLDDGTTYEPGMMHDYVGICLTSDYPYKLYQFRQVSLGKKMMLFIKKDPRHPENYFSRLIRTQVDPNSSYYPNVGYHEYSVVNSACLNELYVAPFTWDL